MFFIICLIVFLKYFKILLTFLSDLARIRGDNLLKVASVKIAESRLSFFYFLSYFYFIFYLFSIFYL